jgi:hypothetical protein
MLCKTLIPDDCVYTLCHPLNLTRPPARPMICSRQARAPPAVAETPLGLRMSKTRKFCDKPFPAWFLIWPQATTQALPNHI